MAEVTAPDKGSDELLTVNEACERLRVSRPTLYTMMRERTISWVQLRGRRRIRESELRRLVEANTTTGA